MIAGLLLLVAIALLGKDAAQNVDMIETWITSLGPWAILVFVCIYVLGTSMMIPESVLSIAAGAMFGLVWGLAAVVVGSVIAAALQYALSQHLLRQWIGRFVAARPTLAAVQTAVSHNEFKLQVLLRLTPLNPATISYLLGAAGVRFRGFLLASFAVFPHLLLEVYFGFAGKQVARLAGRTSNDVYLHGAIVISGLVFTIIVIVLVSRMAQKAVVDALPKTATGAMVAAP